MIPRLSVRGAACPNIIQRCVAMIKDGSVRIEPFLETKPMSMIERVFEDQHAGKYDRRQVLEPDFS